jgi:hypothetical protein
MGQLAIRYGHVALGRPAALDDFFDLYTAWLHEHGTEHTPATFRRWVFDEYRGGHACAWERFERTSGPLRRGEPIVYQVRVRNTGAGTWRLSPLSSGTHLAVAVSEAAAARTADKEAIKGKAGLFDARVAPGESIDLTVIVPPIHKAGRYRLLADMVDPRHGWFYQVGGTPFEEELYIP